MEKELQKRKSTHLNNYDYSNTGVYFVTVCIEGRKQILSEIIKTNDTAVDEINNLNSVGEGLAPPENEKPDQTLTEENYTSFANRFNVRLTKIGEVVKEQLANLEERFRNVKIKGYVIMPDHIHILLYLCKEAGGASPSPTLHDVVCAFKSLTSRFVSYL